MTTSSPPPEFAALIGIDWACAQHALCTYDCASGQIERSTLEQTPEAIAHWAQSLRQRYNGRQLALCLEQAKGPLIYALMAYEFLTLYPVNPATSARYRQAFKTSRAKDDPDDAQVCMELLLYHRAKLTPWLPDDSQTRELTRLLEGRRGAVDLRTLLTNMLRAVLQSTYPQALALAGQDLYAPMACHFLLKWPCLARLQEASKDSVRKFYYAQRCRRMDLIEKRLQSIAALQPLTTDPALIQPALLQISMLARQLLDLARAIKTYEQRIEELFTTHRDVSLWQSFPGAGPTLAPRLCCAFGTARSRYENARAIQQYSGIAPVTEKSGKNQHWVHRRYSRPHFIHQSFFEYASQSVLHCRWAKLFLQEQIARGKTYPSAVRALAFKWQRIMFRCWRERTTYDENKYLESLQRHGSFLAARLRDSLPKAA